MRFIIIVFFLIASCSPQLVYNYRSHGLLVTTNNANIEKEKIDALVIVIEDAIYDIYGFQSNLGLVFQKHSCSLTFVEPGNSNLRGYRGLTLTNATWSNTKSCYESYYIAGHELLHLVGRYLFKVTNEVNREHSHPNLFFNWTTMGGKSRKETVEYWVDLYAKEICKDEEN